MPHQVLVGIPKEVVAFCPVGAEVQSLKDCHQLREPVLHLLAATELVVICKVGNVDDSAKVVGVGEAPNDLIDLVADLLVALDLHHVPERPALGNINEVVGLPRILVRDVLHEEKSQDVILVLGRVHPATKLVATAPERGVEIRLLDHRDLPLPGERGVRRPSSRPMADPTKVRISAAIDVRPSNARRRSHSCCARVRAMRVLTNSSPGVGAGIGRRISVYL